METGNLGVSPSDQGQKEAFLNELGQFLSDKGRFLCRTPNLSGRTIDLHDLYNKVTSAGGYQKVTERGYWEDFLDVYGYPASSSTLAYGLQKVYQLYLEDYERVHYFGDDEPQPFFRNYPGGYRKYRYKISDMQRMQANMNMSKPCVSDYDRVVLSLESCLPNEIDFAVNACTLLSGESRHVLRLPECRRIVDALLLHAGIVSDGHDSYREVLEELQNKTKHNYKKFWNNSIAKKSVIPILLPSIKKRQETNPSGTASNKDESREGQNNSDIEFSAALQKRLQDIEQEDVEVEEPVETDFKVAKKSKWSELFHGHRSLGVEDYEGQRVLQIALVLLNLSFEDFNVSLLARHPSLIRFVFLCIHSEYSCLRQTGLDILSNISSHMQLLHLQYDIMSMIFDTINTAVLSHDKFRRIRGFEVLGNICRRRPNADRISVYVCDDVYDAAVQNLMISDVEIILAAIEALYRLSKLGEATCTKIIVIKGCIDILMCLVTLNVRTFGQEKLSEIRLARKILPGQSDHASQHQRQALPAYHMPTQQTVPHPNHTAMMQRQMQFQQQQTKFGSAHQAQPTFAPAASIVSPSSALVMSQSRLPLPQPSPNINPTINVQPKTEPNPTPPPQPLVQQQQSLPQPQVATPQSPQTAPQLPPPVVSSPPPSSGAQPQVKSSPPGAGPTYTHSETGTVPPVFHYMPAPPNNIVQDGSPDSFTKLWIWATYEAQPESYIPRVDVYCEYLASSNRYGRQGKTEILSATDFGKCLKQIFPHATSRLFNQGRGQPQYHIAGIKKRATPLPVPGHQLKDSHSVFSSDSDQVAVARQPVPAPVISKTRPTPSTTPRPNLPSPPIPASSTAVPIQQLQFQPILIVSAVPGTNNVALVSGGQLATTTAIFNTSEVMAMQQPPVEAACTTSVTTQATVNTQQPQLQAYQAAASSVSQIQQLSTDQSAVAPSAMASDHEVTVPDNLECEQMPQGMVNFVHTQASETQPDTVGIGQTTSDNAPALSSGSATESSSDALFATPVSDAAVNASSLEQTTDPVDSVEQATSQFQQASNPTAPLPALLEADQPVIAPDGEIRKADSNCSETNNHSQAMTESEESFNENLRSSTPVKDNAQTVDESLGNGLEISLKVNDAKADDCNHSSLPAVTNGYMELVPKDCDENEKPKNETIHKSKDKEIDKTASDQTKNCRKRRRTKSKDAKQMVNGITEDLCKKDSTISEENTHKNNGPNGPTSNEFSQENKNIVNGESETEAAVNSILDPSDTSVDDIMKMDISDVIISPTAQKNENFETEIEKIQEEQKNVDDHLHPGKEGKDVENKNEPLAQTLHHDPLHVLQSDAEAPSTCQVSGTETEVMTVSTCLVSQADTADVSNCTNQTVAAVTLPSSNVTTCLSMTPTTQTLTPDTQVQMTPTNPIPHSALNQRLKDTITRRKNSQFTTSSTPSNSLPPSVIQQYSYKMHDNQNLAQQIIPITPQQLQQQYHQQRQVPLQTNHSEQPYQVTSSVGSKRPAVTTTVGPPAKIQRPPLPPPTYTPNPSYPPQYQAQQHHSSTLRPPLPTTAHRPPHPQPTQQHHMPPRPNTPLAMPPRPNTPLANNPHAGTQPKAKPPTIDLMAPNASLLVLYRNVGKIPFANHMDEKEDAISKSVRLTAALILTNIARYSNLGRSLLQKHEDNLARVAMSQMDCSPIVARLLSELDI